MSHLCIAYFTSRKEPKIEWFLDSLHRETGGNYGGIKVVIVDFWMNQHGHEQRLESWRPKLARLGDYVITPPKSSVWQGPKKLTKEDWFDACAARNTAICLAPDGWIAFVDDLSVLMPGWLSAVREAMSGPQNRITCGGYGKLKDMVVDNGELHSFTPHPPGRDVRFREGATGPVKCGGSWMFGCSLVAPVEAFLSINGFPEALCAGLGFEDCIAGIMLEKQGYEFAYDQRMMTYESEELHAQLPIMKRSDYGVSPNDKSHAVLRIAQQGSGWHPNYFGQEGIRGLRKRVLAGEPFPIMKIPQHEWWTGTLLENL